jgi:hypothetical protein
MKKVFSLTLTLSALLFISISAVFPAKTHPLKFSGNFYVDNGTAWNGTVSGSGAISVSGAPYYPTGQYLIQALSSASYITVTVNCSAPGTHTYGLTGGISPAPTPIVTSSGTATFTNVPVTTGDIAAYIH